MEVVWGVTWLVKEKLSQSLGAKWKRQRGKDHMLAGRAMKEDEEKRKRMPRKLFRREAPWLRCPEVLICSRGKGRGDAGPWRTQRKK